MGELYLDRIERTAVQKGCVHYWIIDPPVGGFSSGVCKYCGLSKDFSNSFEKAFINRERHSGDEADHAIPEHK